MRISLENTHFEKFMNQMIRYLLCEPKLTRITQMYKTTIVAHPLTNATNWRLAVLPHIRDELRVRFQSVWIAGELARQF